MTDHIVAYPGAATLSLEDFDRAKEALKKQGVRVEDGWFCGLTPNLYGKAILEGGVLPPHEVVFRDEHAVWLKLKGDVGA